MSYQGRLTDSSGTLLGGTGTNYYFRFSIYNSPTVGSGSRLWPTAAPASTTINVANGVFNVNIGDTTGGYPDALTYDFMQNSDIFLQVEVSFNGTTFETLAPRQRIAASGFAINAGTLSGDMRTSSTADFNFNVLNIGTGKANLNIATGSLLFGGTVRIDSIGQATFATTSITTLNLNSLGLTGGLNNNNLFTINTSSSVPALHINNLGNISVGTSTFNNTFGIQGTALTNIFGIYTSSNNPAFKVNSVGKILVNTISTSTGQLNIVGSTGLVSGVAGLYQESLLNATSSGSFQFGNRHIINISPTASSSMDGEFIRTIDNTSLANTVRAMEIQAWSGTNIQGINTGLWAAGRTFGVQAFSNGTASGVLNGAALYGEIQSTSTGNGLRLYSKNIASSSQDLALLFQEISNFQGNGLKMDFGRTGGAFTGNFLNFNNNAVSKFAVNATGSVMIGTSTAYGVSNLLVCAQGNCTLPTATNTVAVFASTNGTATGSSIIARGTITQGAADVGEYAYIEGLATDYDAGDLLAISEATSTRFKKTSRAYMANLAGVVTKTAGFIGGGEIAGQADTVVIALAGRVPVKVSGENGSIKLGDSITASSIVGYGMKSTLPGRVVGMALEDFNASSATATGTIMIFVNPSYSFPNSVEYENLQGGNSGVSAMNTFAFDKKLTVKIATLIAGKITVEDLTIGSEEHPAGITIFDVKTKKPYCVVMEDGATKNYSGKCSDLDLNNLGQPYFDSDMGGFVVVLPGTKTAEISFAQEYLVQPIVSANISLNSEGNSSTSTSNIKFTITNTTTNGFKIIFDEPTPEDIKISWIALAAKNVPPTPPTANADTPAESNPENNATETNNEVTDAPAEVPAETIDEIPVLTEQAPTPAPEESAPSETIFSESPTE